MGERATASFGIDRWEEQVAIDDGTTKVVRTTIHKTFTGGLVGTARGAMTMAHANGTMAYQGYDLLDIELGGRRGTLVVVHDAWRRGYAGDARWTILAGSGTAGLAGIAGTATIARHDDGSHTLVLDYTLDGSPASAPSPG
ncbi:MAG: DUF3224 domain-containing protein [Myxococcota bacterium]